ncbi:hypothetical protein CHU00_15745 [Sphingobacterium cellulitidis]|uniref:hypothetical protein n=1 Tax=Sphingobacterium cellulitidis TaxID=1768011 RepID=UPI000B93A4EC|nr:hypothetical protein [Sphingobacterium cellulitidis]OYD44646.1 hypothetical protein CHU00_15745 [Sphingobacterium cellulitidis]
MDKPIRNPRKSIMKNLTLVLFLLFCSKSYAQIDTTLIYRKADNIIRLNENNNIDSLIINSTGSIRCILCEEVGLKKYIHSKTFFTHKMQGIFTPELVSKLKKAPKSIAKEIEPAPSYIVYYKIILKDEIAPNHEGVDFGIWLDINDNLKFTAIDTIP